MTEQTKTRTAFTKDERGILNNWAIEPKMYVDEQSDSRVGFTEYAELLNGRLAMVGFTLVVIIEFVTGKGFLQIIGL
ncbi:chlorophyll A-B-binding protein [Pseudanabaena sp. FACHB-1998]|uniref:chlorophyll a/b-binding protein n=1 Tax=Pseudanabaena sp. FACHB-1998 TaxID=2692858 RepID=UPI0016812365|nr:chlorophyll a/b-binding protein [Pseudanabaena sp. FACHB-1998]MBD2177665.1 chlorophyll A-B-binding protein [Pseudanabaena sp. FACHB-1998]